MTLCFYRCSRNFVCRNLQHWLISPLKIFASIFLRFCCSQPLANLFHWIRTICKIREAETECVSPSEENIPRPHRHSATKGSTARAAGRPLPQPGRASASTASVKAQTHSPRTLVLSLKSSRKARWPLCWLFLFKDSLMYSKYFHRN